MSLTLWLLRYSLRIDNLEWHLKFHSCTLHVALGSAWFSAIQAFEPHGISHARVEAINLLLSMALMDVVPEQASFMWLSCLAVH